MAPFVIGPYQPSAAKDKVCSWTFKHESELPAGQKLLRCSGCNETFYASRIAQRAHWPYHRMFCCHLADDEEQVHHAFEDELAAGIKVERLMAEFHDAPRTRCHRQIIQSKKLKGRLLLHALMQLVAHHGTQEGRAMLDEPSRRWGISTALENFRYAFLYPSGEQLESELPLW